jgi:hypothetical protein
VTSSPSLWRTWRRRSSDVLDAAVPAAVVVGAVAVVLAVGLVVLGVVADEVGEREPVVDGDEVDRRRRAPAVVAVEVRGPREPDREVGERPLP